jgi:virginiamycin A acetyltransferase
MFGPDPNEKYPKQGFPQVGFLKNFITRPNIVVGDYTYYDDPDGPGRFETNNVLYHYPFMGDKLVIGKFCAIAKDARFIMNGANHKISGLSTYPFGIFGCGWEKAVPLPTDLPFKGDTVVGNDVWLGYECLVMPGVHIGDGAIIASRALVTRDVDPYSVVGGNPARLIKKRFPDEMIAELEKIQWWNWDIRKITENLEKIVGGDIGELLKAAE